ncbi:MAG: TolC family protein [Flavobacteriales bacterium]|nr:TolC family protein [Flavobacteriales bacterium]
MRVIVLIILVGLSATSCKMGKNFEPIEVQIDSVFRFSNDSILQASNNTATIDSNGLRWWELFQNPQLDSLIETGLKNNKESQTALKSIEAAELAFKNQKTEMLPKFDATGGFSHGNFQGFITPSANTSWYLNGTVNWELDFWGKYRRLNEASRAEYVSNQYAYYNIQLTLINQITTTYFELVAARRSHEISVQTLNLRDSSLAVIQQRFDQGIIPEIDLNQAQIQKSIAQSAVPVYERQIGLTENLLSILIGSNPRAIETAVSQTNLKPVPEIPAGIPSDLLYRRPDVLRAEQMAVAQNARIGAAIAARYPAISLTGLLGVGSNALMGVTSGQLGWSVGAGLTAPLFYFGRNKRRVEIERKKAEQANLQYEQTLLVAFKEVDDALISIQTYRKEMEAREAHVIAAINAQNLSALRYDKGVTSYLEYLEQQRQAFDAQLRYVGAKKNLYQAYIALYKALGGGWLTKKGNSVDHPNSAE